MASETFLCGESSFQDELCICQEQGAFMGERDTFTGPVEQLDFQLFLQCLDLMADCGLCDLQRAGRLGKIQVFRHCDETF